MMMGYSETGCLSASRFFVFLFLFFYMIPFSVCCRLFVFWCFRCRVVACMKIWSLASSFLLFFCVVVLCCVVILLSSWWYDNIREAAAIYLTFASKVSTTTIVMHHLQLRWSWCFYELHVRMMKCCCNCNIIIIIIITTFASNAALLHSFTCSHFKWTETMN